MASKWPHGITRRAVVLLAAAVGGVSGAAALKRADLRERMTALAGDGEEPQPGRRLAQWRDASTFNKTWTDWSDY